MGGEDFSWYLQKIPGAMFRLGVGRPDEWLDLHQGNFDVAEEAIEIGVRVLARSAVRSLSDLTLIADAVDADIESQGVASIVR
jgi:amidohydrolase